jgi:acetyl-CoA carboxylase biotin carboxyl carrier protein
MDIAYLEKIMQLFDESTLTELEIEEEGTQIRLARKAEAPAHPMLQYAPPMPMAYGPQTASAPAAPAQASAAPAAPAVNGTSSKQHEIKSPIVGTFYRAPSPDADPYVQVGQQIGAGTTVCIIEAMKLMNEIESDASGKIVKINVENGQPVEYGQTLMVIELD